MEGETGVFSTVKLRDCATFQEGYVNPSQTVAEYFGDEVKWLRAVDLNDSYVWETSRRLSKAGYESAGKASLLFEPNTLAISKSGTIGRLGILKDFMCGNRAVINIRVNLTQYDNRFIFYSLLQRRAEIEELAAGSVQRNLYCSVLGDLEIQVPSFPVQKAIAAILGALDDKIELNRRMNATLEAMARALFQSWFVDFDPVRAKLDDRQPAGMDAATAALFPASFENSPFGQTPRGWKIRPLSELSTHIGSGATPKGGSSVYVDDGVALVRSQNVYDHEFKWAGLARITPEAAKALDSVALEPDDILFNITGASILRTCVVDPNVLPARVNQHVLRIRAKSPTPSRFLHYQLVRKETKDRLMGLNAGATREAVTKGHLQSLPILVPSDGILVAFDLVTHHIFAKVQENYHASRTLAALRDTLLPKLLSGECRIKDAERFVGRVV